MNFLLFRMILQKIRIRAQKNCIISFRSMIVFEKKSKILQNAFLHVAEKKFKFFKMGLYLVNIRTLDLKNCF